MPTDRTGRLVILSGPSCVGKSPLSAALARLYPELWSRLKKLGLFNSRAPRPGERDGVDYDFRSRSQVEELRSKGRYAVLDVRGDLQAVDVEELKVQLEVVAALLERVVPPAYVERWEEDLLPSDPRGGNRR